jgi:hypothetical protein
MAIRHQKLLSGDAVDTRARTINGSLEVEV